MTRVLSLLHHPHARLLFRLGVGVVFIVASLDKIRNPVGFARATSYYHVLPEETLNLFGLLVPWVEMIGGLALVLGAAARGAAVLIGGLLVVFVIAIVQALARGIDITCGCFTVTPGEGHKVGVDLVVRDILMLVATVPVLRLGGGTLSLDRILDARRGRWPREEGGVS